MPSAIRWSVLAASLAGLMTIGLPASAEHDADPRTNNLHPIGHIQEPASLLNPSIANPNIHTDIAFWGKLAIQGTWLGFNIRNIGQPDNPQQVSFTECSGDQGDIVVWDDVVIRSWNEPALPGATCDGESVAEGFEGLHIFDVGDPEDPELVAQVGTPCGSHTATGVPDPANDRLLVYNSPSDEACPWMDIVEVPLDNPGTAAVIAQEDAGRPCHDAGVILGEAMRAACAGGDGLTVWSLDPAHGGSLEDPELLYSQAVPNVTIGHSAAFTWDGEVIVFGHEPGGGVRPRCLETGADLSWDTIFDPAPVQTDDMKSAFFVEADTGTLLGKWTLPRPQTAQENCTIHNYNVVPLRSGRYLLVSGNYQSGTSVVDFSDPANPVEIAWSDPPPLPIPPPPLDFFGLELGGVWSSYWYNGLIFETNITEGLNIYRFSGRQAAGAIRLDHLNPQTQEFTMRSGS